MKYLKEAYTETSMKGMRDELPPLPSRFQPGDLAVFRTHELDEGTFCEVRAVQFLPMIIFYDVLIGQNHTPGGKNVGMAIPREFDHRLNHVSPELLHPMYTKDYNTRTLRRLRDGRVALDMAQSIPEVMVNDKPVDELEYMYNVMHDGAVALQSLDDLGDPEANQEVMDDMKIIQKRMDLIQKTLKEREEDE